MGIESMPDKPPAGLKRRTTGLAIQRAAADRRSEWLARPRRPINGLPGWGAVRHAATVPCDGRVTADAETGSCCTSRIGQGRGVATRSEGGRAGKWKIREDAAGPDFSTLSQESHACQPADCPSRQRVSPRPLEVQRRTAPRPGSTAYTLGRPLACQLVALSGQKSERAWAAAGVLALTPPSRP